MMWNGYQIGWATPVEGTKGWSIEIYGQEEINDDNREIIESIRAEAMKGLSIED